MVSECGRFSGDGNRIGAVNWGEELQAKRGS